MNEIVYHNNIVMIVVGKHDSYGLADFLTGDHTHQIIDKADCPVLVVPSQLHFTAFKKIAFATDLAVTNIDVLQSLIRLAKYTEAEILLTHVASTKTSDREEQIVIERFFNNVLAKIDYAWISYKAIKSQSIASGLDWVADQSDVDIMVLVHHKRGFFERLFDNSVTQQVANHTVKPLLIFPSAKVAEILPVF
jgi:nucleotide-binding universal stress UspA family protein